MAKGIDVSVYQGNIDWQKVKASGIDFAIIRAGFGVSAGQIDKKFNQNVRGAKDAGVHVGAYWFIYALNEAQAVQNADAFASILARWKGCIDYPVAADYEYDSDNYAARCGVSMSKELRTRIIFKFCERMEQHGYYCANYMNPDYISKVNYSELSRFDLWLAIWGSDKPSRDCGMWQFSSRGSVPGIVGHVDMDTSYRDYPGIIRAGALNYLTQDATPVPDDPEQPVTPEPVVEAEPTKRIEKYTVVRGDTLSAIAQRYGTSYLRIAKDNNIQNPNLIYPGQTLVINL